MNSVKLYTLLAGICLSVNLLLSVESLPLRLPTTTESPPNSPAISSDSDTDVTTVEPTSANPDHGIVLSESHYDPGSIASHMNAIMAILNQPTPALETEQPREDSNLAVSSAAVSSSTMTDFSEENCSSKAAKRGPCRKRSASTEELAAIVLSHMFGGIKRLRGEDPPASTSNWPGPNIDELPVGETSSHSNDNQQSDSGSSSSSDSNESNSSSSEPPTTSTQPTTHM